MIHKLDIHTNSAKLEDLSGTAVARTLEGTTRSILQHVSSVASGVRVEKCSLVFRVSTHTNSLLHALYFGYCARLHCGH
jgi:hypothetical protein